MIMATARFCLCGIASAVSVFLFSQMLPDAHAEPSYTMTLLKTPMSSYKVVLSEPRSDGVRPDTIWGKIFVEDRHAHVNWVAKTGHGQRGEGIFEGFVIDEGPDLWSPDGTYMTYWNVYCIDEVEVESGVTCHSHELHFLALRRESLCEDELVLGRESFGGWVEGRSHAVWELIGDGQKIERLLCHE